MIGIDVPALVVAISLGVGLNAGVVALAIYLHRRQSGTAPTLEGVDPVLANRTTAGGA